jgi:hypothetical protein
VADRTNQKRLMEDLKMNSLLMPSKKLLILDINIHFKLRFHRELVVCTHVQLANRNVLKEFTFPGFLVPKRFDIPLSF